MKAVLWDLDGTILDPAGAITDGIADALVEHGYARPSESELMKFVGPPVYYSLEHFTDVPADKFADIIATYRGRYLEQGIKKSKIYPGVRQTLNVFKAAGYAQALATQKPLHLALDVLKKFDLDGYFEVVGGSRDELSGQNLHMPSDKPGIIAFVLEELQIRYGKVTAVMVGDRLYDGQGASAHGLNSLGVAWGYGSSKELEENFTFTVQDACGLEKTVQNIFGESE